MLPASMLTTNLIQCVGVLPVHGQLNQFLARVGPLVPSSFICSDCITLTRMRMGTLTLSL